MGFGFNTIGSAVPSGGTLAIPNTFGRRAPARTDFTEYLSGTDTRPLSAPEVAALYGGVANGSIKVSPDQFNRLLQPNSDTKGIDTNEWQYYSPEYKAWAQENPQAFMADALAHRNSANQDLGSIGAEGGYSNPMGIKPGGDYSGAGYMQIHDGGGLGSFGTLALAVVGGYALGPLAVAYGGGTATVGSTIAAGATIGGAQAAISGGDILKGAVTGGVSAGIGEGLKTQIGGLGETAADAVGIISPTGVHAVQSAIMGGTKAAAATVINGGSFGDLAKNILTSGAASAANSLVGDWTIDQTGSKFLGGIAGQAAGTAVKTGLIDSPKPGDFSTTPYPNATQQPFGSLGDLALDSRRVDTTRSMFQTQDLSQYGITPTTELRI